MDVDNDEDVSSRLNVHKVITAVICNQMCHHSLFRQKVPMNTDSRSSRVFVIRNKGTEKPKSRSQYLNCLKKLVLSMHFLETNNVVGVKEFLGIFEFELIVLLFGENRSNEKILKNRILPRGQQANPRTWALLLNKWWL